MDIYVHDVKFNLHISAGRVIAILRVYKFSNFRHTRNPHTRIFIKIFTSNNIISVKLLLNCVFIDSAKIHKNVNKFGLNKPANITIKDMFKVL